MHVLAKSHMHSSQNSSQKATPFEGLCVDFVSRFPRDTCTALLLGRASRGCPGQIPLAFQLIKSHAFDPIRLAHRDKQRMSIGRSSILRPSLFLNIPLNTFEKVSITDEKTAHLRPLTHNINGSTPPSCSVRQSISQNAVPF